MGNISKDQSFQSTSMNSKKNIIFNNTLSNLTFGRNDDNSLNTSNTYSNISDATKNRR